jgi:hypothetical protein
VKVRNPSGRVAAFRSGSVTQVDCTRDSRDGRDAESMDAFVKTNTSKVMFG